MSKGPGISCIEQFHGLEVDLTAFKCNAYELFKALTAMGKLSHGLMYICVDRIIFLTEDCRMVGICSQATNAVHSGLFERAEIFVLIQVVEKVQLLTLGNHCIQRTTGSEIGGSGIKVNIAAGSFYFFF